MPSLTVRVDQRTHRILKDLSAQTREPMPAILARAIEEYRRQRFWAQANAAWAALREDPEAWADELAERAAWDVTLMDGQESE